MELLNRCLQWVRRQRIGAELRPAYLKVLAFNVALTAAVVLVFAAVYGMSPPEAVQSVLFHALLQMGIVTGIFLIAQRSLTASATDRYLQAVRDFLPGRQQDDILRELSENIRSEMADRAGELGRPLSRAEQEAILEQIGSPIVVASRYRGDERSVTFGRQLIGPALFPLYLKILLFNVALVVTVLGTLPVALGKPATNMLPMLLLNLCLQFVVITVVFAVFERFRDSLFGWQFPGARPSSPEE
jgi:hypothetical protein